VQIFSCNFLERGEMMKGIEYLRKKLEVYRQGALKRQRIYDMKDDHINFGITIPPEIRKMFKSTLGWGAKAVDAIADRLVFRGFDNDNFNINEIFQLNSADILFDDAKLSALINSCSFIYISEGDDGFPDYKLFTGQKRLEYLTLSHVYSQKGMRY